MKALILELTFSEAFFKVHYTKSFRQTYLIPLPTAVAGMFGAMLGIKRGNVSEIFKDHLFGAKLLKYNGICPDNTTFVQYKPEPEKGVVTSFILNKPSYLIAMACDEKCVEEYYHKIKNEIVYIPYGGQNDFFVEEIVLRGIRDVNKTKVIENYAPHDFVEKIEWKEGTELQILPVRHKLSQNPNFYFIFNGSLKLKEQVYSTEGIGLYSLNDFYFLEGEKNGMGKSRSKRESRRKTSQDSHKGSQGHSF